MLWIFSIFLKYIWWPALPVSSLWFECVPKKLRGWKFNPHCNKVGKWGHIRSGWVAKAETSWMDMMSLWWGWVGYQESGHYEACQPPAPGSDSCAHPYVMPSIISGYRCHALDLPSSRIVITFFRYKLARMYNNILL